MAYPPLGSPRRSRRRIITTIFLLVVVTIGVVALAVRFRTERRDSIDYLAMTKEIADQQIGMAGSVLDMLITLHELDRPDILDRVVDLDVEFQNLERDLSQITVTAAVGEANGFFVVAIDSWGEALAEFDNAIIEVLDGEDDGRMGDAMLERVFSNFRVGDRAYAGFLEAVAVLDEDLRAPTYPEVTYVDATRLELYDARLIADRLRQTLRFEENRDVSIVATTEPEPLGADSGIPVVPESESFVVRVVVTNEGNVPAELITVSLSLVEMGGQGSIDRSEIVAALDPGQATTVPFEDLALVPGGRYQLRITADLAQDEVLDNNTWDLDFVRSEP